MVKDIAFPTWKTVESGKETIELVAVSLEDFGASKHWSGLRIIDQAAKLGLRLCPEEITASLRREESESGSFGEWFVVPYEARGSLWASHYGWNGAAGHIIWLNGGAHPSFDLKREERWLFRK